MATESFEDILKHMTEVAQKWDSIGGGHQAALPHQWVKRLKAWKKREDDEVEYRISEAAYNALEGGV